MDYSKLDSVEYQQLAPLPPASDLWRAYQSMSELQTLHRYDDRRTEIRSDIMTEFGLCYTCAQLQLRG